MKTQNATVTRLFRFLDRAASEGFVLNGICAADLFMEIFDFEDRVSRQFSAEAAKRIQVVKEQS